MTREQKLALILGFALVLVVGVLVSDHISRAERNDALSTDGLDGAIAQRSGGAGSLLVNRDADLPAPISATAERDFARDDPQEGGLFRGLERGLREKGQRFGELPTALNTTGDRDERVTRPEARREEPVREWEMGKPQLRVGETEPARVYRVQPNDSLWAIAEREYDDGKLHEKLARYNHDRVAPNGGLRKGATILIPTKRALLAWEIGDEREVRRGSAPSASRTETAPTPRVRTYVVKAGETLSEICQEQLGKGSRWREVVELNGGDIPEDGTVRRGQEIRLPAS